MNDYEDNSLYHRPRGKAFRTIVLFRLCRNTAGAASSVRYQSIQLVGLLHRTRNELCLVTKNTQEVHTIINILFQEKELLRKTFPLDHLCQHGSSELADEFHKRPSIGGSWLCMRRKAIRV